MNYKLVKKKSYEQLLLANQGLEKEILEAKQLIEAMKKEMQEEEQLLHVQDDLNCKNIEIEEVRRKEREKAEEQTEAQKVVMIKTIEKFRRSETLLIEKITALEKELHELKCATKLVCNN